MADEHIRTPADHVSTSRPRPSQPGPVDGFQTGIGSQGSERGAKKQRVEPSKRGRWIAFGIFFVLYQIAFAAGIGFLMGVFGFRHAGFVSAAGVILATYILWRIEGNGRLSHLFGLQTSPYVSPVKAYLYEKVWG